MDLIFRDLDVDIKQVRILSKVCGMVKPGEMLAVMGASGAGKSTLLNSLSGCIPIKDGVISLNGQQLSKRLKRKIAYVMQQDAFLPSLTVRETLMYKALLKLPDSMLHEKKLQTVNNIIDTLELRKCAETVIGCGMVSGISGGERKRTSIACELLTNPLVLLIDEPTSGLDSATAYNLMQSLTRYTESSQRTLVTTIHQPSVQMFHKFHNLLLLADGKVAYFGEGDQVLTYFSNLGFHCEPQFNPADFILEKVTENSETTAQILEHFRTSSHIEWPNHVQGCASVNEKINGSYGVGQRKNNPHIIEQQSPTIRADNPESSIPQKGLASYDNPAYTGTFAESSGKRQASSQKELSCDTDWYDDGTKKWPTAFWTQYKTLTRRAITVSKARIFSLREILQSIYLTIFVGILWFQNERTEIQIKDFSGYIFFVTVHVAIQTSLNGTFAFNQHKDVFIREHQAGTYRLSAYYLSTLTRGIPINYPCALIFAIVTYWMVGQTPVAWVFFASIGILILDVTAANSIGTTIGIIAGDVSLATISVMTVNLTCMLLTSFFRPHLPFWLEWMRYMSYINYAYSAGTKVQYMYGADFSCNPDRNSSSFEGCQYSSNYTISGEDILITQGLTAPIWTDIIGLLVIIVIFKIFGYLCLRYLNRQSGN